MRTFDATGITHLVVELGGGSVDLRPAEDDRIAGEIHSDDPDQVRDAVVDTFGAELRVIAPQPAKRWSSSETRVRMQVPAGTDLTLTTGSGDLTADVRLGRVAARSGSGDLRLAATRSAQVSTGSGDVTVLSVEGDADLHSGSGDLRVERCGGGLAARTASGDVSIGRLDGSAEVKLASGEFRLAATTGSVNVRTASGDIGIGVAESLPAWLDLKSGSGDVAIALPPTGEPEPGAPYVSIYARAGSGDIKITRA